MSVHNLQQDAKRTLIGISMLLILAGGMFVSAPRPVYAFLGIVLDPTVVAKTIINGIKIVAGNILTASLVTKEYALDPIAWIIAKSTLRSITSDLVTNIAEHHINQNGTSGPGFVTNLKKYIGQTGDFAENRFVTGAGTGSSYSQSYNRTIANAVNTTYTKNTASNYWSAHTETLSNTVPNTHAFLNGDFGAGGWNGWKAINANSNNNPYYAYEGANNALNTSVSNAQTNKVVEANWAQGFLSKTNCNSDGTSCSIQTPGSVIKAQLDKALGSGISSLVSADEISEIIGNLAQNLVSKAIGGGSGGGLLGIASLSQGGSSSYISQYKNGTPTGSLSQINTSLQNAINRKESNIHQYISNLQKILSSESRAENALRSLINYTSPNSSCPVPYSNIVTAKASLNGVIIKYSETQVSITSARTGLIKLEQIKSNAQVAINSGSATSIAAVGAEFQKIITDGTLPTVQQISQAQTNSLSFEGMTTTVGTMNKIAQSANLELQVLQTQVQQCINNLNSSNSNNWGGS